MSSQYVISRFNIISYMFCLHLQYDVSTLLANNLTFSRTKGSQWTRHWSVSDQRSVASHRTAVSQPRVPGSWKAMDASPTAAPLASCPWQRYNVWRANLGAAGQKTLNRAENELKIMCYWYSTFFFHTVLRLVSYLCCTSRSHVFLPPLMRPAKPLGFCPELKPPEAVKHHRLTFFLCQRYGSRFLALEKGQQK